MKTQKPPAPAGPMTYIDIILGRNSVAHPVNELRSIALDISAAVCDGAAFLDKQLDRQDSDRLDTNRRKLAALTNVPASVPRAAAGSAQVHAAVIGARAAAGITKTATNRRWYHELQQLGADRGRGQRPAGAVPVGLHSAADRGRCRSRRTQRAVADVAVQHSRR